MEQDGKTIKCKQYIYFYTQEEGFIYNNNWFKRYSYKTNGTQTDGH